MARLMPDFPILRSGLSANAKLVLLVIKFHVGKHNYCQVLTSTLMQEASLSRSQVFNCLKTLKEERWITVEAREGCSSKYRLFLPKFEGSLEEGYPSTTETGPVHQEDGGSPPQGPLPSTTETHKILTKNKTKNKTKSGCSPEEDQEGVDVKAKDVLKKHQAKDPIQKKKGAYGLELLWKTTCSSVFPEDMGFVDSFTKTQIGLCAQYIKKCGKADPWEVMRHTLENWSSFGSYITDIHLTKAPILPNLAFVVKYSMEAINFRNKGTASPVQVIAPTPKPQSPAPQASPAAATDDNDYVSLEEMLDLG